MKSFYLPATVLVTLGLFGCDSPGRNLGAELSASEQAYRARDYQRAIPPATSVIQAGRAGPELTRALYIRGMALALVGRRAEAYADLQRAVREGRDPGLSWQPYAALGVLYFEDEQWSAAGRVLEDAVERMPGAPPMDAYLWRLGLCYERLGRWPTALTTYRRLVERFGTGPYAEQAARRLRLQPAAFAVQCGVFAQRSNAEQLASELRKQGLPVTVRSEERSDGVYSVVLEGSYGSYAEASRALARVRGYVADAVLWP